jgi:primosomal protein N' (replication factor Y)
MAAMSKTLDLSERYVEVAVDAPVGHSRTFSYSVPSRFSVSPGQLVWVPFGRRVAQGVVVQLAGFPQVEVTRDILHPVEPGPLVSEALLDLGRWLSRYYLCSLFAAIGPMLPPGFETQVRSHVMSAPGDAPDLSHLKPQTCQALQVLAAKSRLPEATFLKLLGKGAEGELARLLGQGFLRRQVDLPRPRVAPRYQSYLFRIGDNGPSAEGAEAEAWESLPRRQRELLRAVSAHYGKYPAASANKEFGYGVAGALVEKGLLGLEWVRVEATPRQVGAQGEAGPPVTLTVEQADALARITETLDGRAQSPRSFLLHGVTGSGKTEVYLRAIRRVVERGLQAVYLVPEIALTPQTLQRVNARFPGRVAVIHSRLSLRQRFDQWWGIRDGHYDVVVGPRSSIFAPLDRLGLIIIDEEHEWTYKQEEAQPLYHARTVALELARRTGATVILGSATPDVETYHGAERGRHRLLELTHRIGAGVGAGGRALASVDICDMRRELREGNRSIFSRQLSQSLKECVRQGHQAILFLNRRGDAPIVQCRDCGYVATCPRCSVALTYHSTLVDLLCHRCNRRARLPRRCRRCGQGNIRQLGIGTQRVVDEVARLLPGVRVERWDADATRSGLNPEEAMGRLASGETQVLVGTQVVAKGLDVPNVTLVGIVLADVGLYLSDFRAGERAFGLLCQVAGRAGRGPFPGRVVVQTYNPEHYAIVAALEQDYSAMYRQEVQTRGELGNPPFNQLVHIVFQDINATACQRQAVAIARQLRQRVYAEGLTDVEVVGPAPGIPSRLRGRFRWHLLLRGRNLHQFLEGSTFPKGTTIDVDPAHVL